LIKGGKNNNWSNNYTLHKGPKDLSVLPIKCVCTLGRMILIAIYGTIPRIAAWTNIFCIRSWTYWTRCSHCRCFYITCIFIYIFKN